MWQFTAVLLRGFHEVCGGDTHAASHGREEELLLESVYDGGVTTAMFFSIAEVVRDVFFGVGTNSNVSCVRVLQDGLPAMLLLF